MAGEWARILGSYGVTGPPVKGEPSEFESARSTFDTMYTHSNDIHQTFKKITDEGVPEERLNNQPGQLLLRSVEAVDAGLSDLPRVASEARDIFADHITKLNDLRARADEALGHAQTAWSNRQSAQSAVDDAPDDADNIDDLNDDLDHAKSALDAIYNDDYLGLHGEEAELNERTIDRLDGIDLGTLEEIAPGIKQLIQLGTSAVDWLEWLAGPEGPSFEDGTALVAGLQSGIGNLLDGVMGVGPLAFLVGKTLGFEYVEGQDFYTTNRHSIQSYLGFHDAFDKVGKLGGMDLRDEKFEFSADGVDYRLELWKGGYGAGGAFGGEIGLYTRKPGERGLRGLLEQIPGFYSSATGDDQIKMTQTIYNKHTGQEYFRNDAKGAAGGDHYWNLAIRTDPGVRHEDLGQRGTLQVKDPRVGREMYAAMKHKGLKAEISEDGKTITYTWE